MNLKSQQLVWVQTANASSYLSNQEIIMKSHDIIYLIVLLVKCACKQRCLYIFVFVEMCFFIVQAEIFNHSADIEAAVSTKNTTTFRMARILQFK